eukprot:CAMPEP_0194256002 /NCGR_PEP_ID=MMETSP0158-20130606/35781_1 /TAXON_ID=33649 /ORGANISM="Thalassionema nitzschioides, Strain L26-B" /LENGTH=499 /DNA_ID=CAMNT_0038994545 /DNA_START=62 /DNA_END=1558 /DNA_ORIENTATION=-
MPSLVSTNKEWNNVAKTKTTVPSFVMSLDGVEFRLEPVSSFGANIDFQPNSDSDCISLNLSNFTGSLKVMPTKTSQHCYVPRVSLSPEKPVKTKKTSQKKRNSPPASTPSSVVSDTSSSNERKKPRHQEKEKQIGEDLSHQDDTAKEDIAHNDIVGESHDNELKEKTAEGNSNTADEEYILPSQPPAFPREEGELVPSPRWGHTVTTIDNNRTLVYGGQSGDGLTQGDIMIYSAGRWCKPVNVAGVKRQWHSAVFVEKRQLVIVFGGESLQKGRMVAMNEVMVLDTEIMLWYPPSVSGEIPSGRSGHSASLVEGKNMIIFGGVRGQKWQNSAAVLDTHRWKWSSLKVAGDAPRPRSYHSANIIHRGAGKDWIVIFGGNDAKNCFNTVHVLEMTPKGQCCWIHPLVSGEIPAPRTGHASTLLKDGTTILIHGGWDPTDDDEDDSTVFFRDSFLLDTTTWTWTKTSTQTELGRVGHGAVHHAGSVQVFGGRLSTEDMTNDW